MIRIFQQVIIRPLETILLQIPKPPEYECNQERYRHECGPTYMFASHANTNLKLAFYRTNLLTSMPTYCTTTLSHINIYQT